MNEDMLFPLVCGHILREVSTIGAFPFTLLAMTVEDILGFGSLASCSFVDWEACGMELQQHLG